LLGAKAAAAMAAESPPAHIEILLSDSASYYRDTESALRSAWQAAGDGGPMAVTRLLADAMRQQPAANSWIVAIGSPAAVWASGHYPDGDVVSVLISRQSWDDLNAAHTGAGRRAAVIIDQPLDRVLALGLLLKPDSRRIGAVFGPASIPARDELEAAVTRRHRTFHAANIATEDNPVNALAPVISSADLFLAIPDRGAFNRAIAKWVLYLGFRQKIPVIGFSKSYSEAGALASIYSTPEDIGNQAGDLLARLVKGDTNDGALWALHQPIRYTLYANPGVARALGIDLPDEASLYRLYHEYLAAPP
jgi:ABC-type uncharacterized transport system substrate-binding protein